MFKIGMFTPFLVVLKLPVTSDAGQRSRRDTAVYHAVYHDFNVDAALVQLCAAARVTGSPLHPACAYRALVTGSARFH